MLGSIYTDEKCPVCGGIFTYDENRSGLFCNGNNTHPEIAHMGRCRVYFKTTSKRFSTTLEGHQFLNHLRVKYPKGSYDPRDYKKENPLGFSVLADQWLNRKEMGIKGRVLSKGTMYAYKNYMRRAKLYWVNKNIKEIINNEADIEDFLFGIAGISEKTRANHRSCYHDFFHWVCRREKIQPPIIPAVPFQLEYRKYTDYETQCKILEEIRRISYDINPKIVFGIELLCTYADLRPSDLLKISEGDIDTEYGAIVIHFPTKRKNRQKVVRLADDHIAEFIELKRKYPALPAVKFFRHVTGISGCRADRPFGNNYFYRWFKQACMNLKEKFNYFGIDELDLYGATRHTTTNETAKLLGREKAKMALGNTTNKAIERYLQHPDDNERLDIVITLRKKRGAGKITNLANFLPDKKEK